jgi:hypothetical protein
MRVVDLEDHNGMREQIPTGLSTHLWRGCVLLGVLSAQAENNMEKTCLVAIQHD